ncbi:MAG: VOC family protein [Gemmatimonas sp.]
MISNRSIPDSVVIPVLRYPAVPEAVAWLCSAFAFVERLRIADHRVQLHVPGGGAVVVAHSHTADGIPVSSTDSVMVRVADVDAHCARATQHGATIMNPPTDFPYGERQYSLTDPWGQAWTFTQTLADVDPSSWGGTLISNV